MRGLKLREHVLDTATTLFGRDGFRATGVDAVVKEAGIAKRSLYNHFDSKEELIAGVLRRRHAAYAAWLPAKLAERADTPAGRLLAWFDLLGEERSAADHRGCMFFNAALDAGESVSVRAMLAENNRFTHALLVELLTAAGADKPEAAALELGIVRRGAQMTAAVTGRAASFSDAKRVAVRVLEAYGVRPRGGGLKKKRPAG